MIRRVFVRRLVCGLAAVFTLSGALAAAQETTVRFYIVPKAGTGARNDPFRAKYLADDPAIYPGGTGAIGGSTSAMDYGLENVLFVAAAVTPAEDALVSSQPDVITIPNGPLDDVITSINLTSLKNSLENLKIPAGWVNNGHSYRDVVRFITQLFRVFQRYHAITGTTLFTSGITLDSTFGQLSQGQRNALQQVAIDLGISTAGITGSTTLRQALRALGPQLAAVSLLGVDL